MKGNITHIGHDFNDLSRTHTVLMKNNTILSSVLVSDKLKAEIIEETILTAHNLSDVFRGASFQRGLKLCRGVWQNSRPHTFGPEQDEGN